jgi:hypothetical protein
MNTQEPALDKWPYCDGHDPKIRALAEATWPLLDACDRFFEAHADCPGCGFCEEVEWLDSQVTMAEQLIGGFVIGSTDRPERADGKAEPYAGPIETDPYAMRVCEAIWPLQDAVRAMRAAHANCRGCDPCWDSAWLRISLQKAESALVGELAIWAWPAWQQRKNAAKFSSASPAAVATAPPPQPEPEPAPIVVTSRPQPTLGKRNYWEPEPEPD